MTKRKRDKETNNDLQNITNISGYEADQPSYILLCKFNVINVINIVSHKTLNYSIKGLHIIVCNGTEIICTRASSFRFSRVTHTRSQPHTNNQKQPEEAEYNWYHRNGDCLLKNTSTK
jgi:hypothetical protein